MRQIIIAALALCLASTARAAPRADLWPRWERHNPHSAATIDHSAWNAFVGRHVINSTDGVNRIAYGGVAGDRVELVAYLERLAAVPIREFARDEQAAFWINLYNALTVKVVLDHYPVRSIRDINISPGLFSSGPWGRKLITVEGEAVSLDDIEHRILRPIWRDPRIHYALNCASVGCPNLAQTAYTAANLDTLLTQGARQFINHPRGALIEEDRLKVSSIYIWFAEDFGRSDAGVIAHLSQYASSALTRRLAAVSRIADHDYDWSLNDLRD